MCETLKGVYLQPYWMIVVSTAIFWILNTLLQSVWYWIKHRGEGQQQPLMPIPFRDQIKQPNRLLLVYMVLKNWLYVIWTLSIMDGQGSRWDQYTHVGLSLLNSGYLGDLAALALIVVKAGSDEDTDRLFPVVFTMLLLLAPYGVTHIITGMFMYCWVLAPPAGILVILGQWISGGNSWVVKLLMRVGLVFYIVLFYQTGFHYAVLIYDRGTSYIKVIPREFELRNSACYWRHSLWYTLISVLT